MGKLTTTKDLELPINWYFKDAKYNNSRDGWSVIFPNNEYQYGLAIHYDVLNDTYGLRIDIRKWIEENIDDLVFMDTIDKTYEGYQVSNYWVLFYFEKEESALMFKLRFGEYIKDVTDKHPRYLDEY